METVKVVLMALAITAIAFGIGWWLGGKIENIKNNTFKAFLKYMGVTLLWLVIWNGNTNIHSSFWSGVVNILCFLAWVSSIISIALGEYRQK